MLLFDLSFMDTDLNPVEFWDQFSRVKTVNLGEISQIVLWNQNGRLVLFERVGLPSF